MKTLFKYSYLAIMAMVALAITACSDDDDYTRATTSGQQVYFLDTQETTLNFTDKDNSVSIPLVRVNTAAAATVPVDVVLKENSKLTCANKSVTFAAGENTSELTITFDPATFEYDEFEDVKLSIAGGNANEYGISTLNCKIGKPAPWESLGKALYREDIISALFGVDNEEYEVEIQANLNEPGIYRLVNPYGAAYPNNEEGDWDASVNHYMVINAKDPNKVYMERLNSTVDWSYGEMIMWSLADYYLSKGDEASAEEYYGKLENGVITFPAGSLLFAMRGYNNGRLYTANNNGMFRIVFPGVVVADYSAEIEVTGRLIDPEGNGQAVFNVTTFGADVASVKVAMAPGKDPMPAYELVMNDDESVQTLYEPGEVRFAYPEPGNYVAVAVTYDADGKAQDAVYTVINIPAEGTETYTAIGTYTHGVKSFIRPMMAKARKNFKLATSKFATFKK